METWNVQRIVQARKNLANPFRLRDLLFQHRDAGRLSTSCDIVWGDCSKDPYYEYINSGRSYHISHGLRYECHYAQQISHLQELGIKTDQAISTIGITNPRKRLEALGDLVQMIPYEILNEAPPTVVLSKQKGDCSEKSALMMGILQNDPWNMMPSFIWCGINGNPHAAVGIDVNDIGGGTDSDFTVAPSDSQLSSGFTDTEYAFFDMTWDSNIGQRSDGVSGYDGEPIQIHAEGDFKFNTDQLGSPPNY